MSDVITFANEILKTDPFMYTLKLGLPELISGRQFVAPAKRLPIQMNKFIRNTLKSASSFLSCSNFQCVDLVISSQKGKRYQR